MAVTNYLITMIETPRLRLVSVSETQLADLMAERSPVVDDVPVTVPPEWADLWVDHPDALAYTLTGLRNDPALQALGWWSYLFVQRDNRTLIGMGGFRGKPDAAGMVEIGYAIVAPYRSRGLATEAARAMTDFALGSPAVRRVQAHTLAVDNESNRLLKTIGYQYNGTINDPDDGAIWQWILDKATS